MSPNEVRRGTAAEVPSVLCEESPSLSILGTGRGIGPASPFGLADFKLRRFAGVSPRLFADGSPQAKSERSRRISSRLAVAGRGNRTPTVLSDLRILSPLRLPISPSRLAKLIVVVSIA